MSARRPLPDDYPPEEQWDIDPIGPAWLCLLAGCLLVVGAGLWQIVAWIL